MSELTRRDWLTLTLGATGALALSPAELAARPQGGPANSAQPRLLTRAIPSSGEMLPVIGLGSSATFSQVARKEDATALGEVLQALVKGGGSVFDTAPGYGASEQVAGRIARITLREGDSVRAGSVLARMSPTPLDPRTRSEAAARQRPFVRGQALAHQCRSTGRRSNPGRSGVCLSFRRRGEG